MSIKGKAYIMGAYEHPLRDAPDKSTPQIHAECAKGALEDAGLTKDDIDGYFCAGDAPGFGAMSMVDYMGLKNVRHMDSTETGGSSYLLHVGHAAQRRVVLKLEDHAREFTAGAVLVPRKLRNQVQQLAHAFALKR